jgi:hypothetical protein
MSFFSHTAAQTKPGRSTLVHAIRLVLNRLKPLLKVDAIWWSLIALGTVLRLRQYLANRSLWADEASLAINLVSRTFQGLTLPLDYEQGSPIGFLFIEKLLIVALGNRDYVLRLFPLFAGVAATYLIYRIARLHLGKAGIFAVLMFATSGQLIYYSSELKQYSSDVLMAVLLVYLASACFKERVQVKDFLLLGMGGMLAIWISHPAAFVLAGIGLVLGFEKLTRRDRVSILWVLGLGAAWMAAFGLEYVVSLRHLVADEFLQHYWNKAFVPLPPWSNRRWFVDTYFSLVFTSLNRGSWTLALLLAILLAAGSLSMLARNWKLALTILLPFLVALIASALQKYPLKLRFLLFLVPLVLLLAAEGLRYLYALVSKWRRGPALAFYILLSSLIFVLSGAYRLETLFRPIMGANIKPVMEYVSRNRNPDDTIYVYHGSDPAFKYYAPFYGLDTGEVIVGFDTTRKKIALEGFFSDMDRLRGNPKVWFIFSDIVDCGGCEGDMQAFYVDYLNGLGTMLDSFRASGANAYLYDLDP